MSSGSLHTADDLNYTICNLNKREKEKERNRGEEKIEAETEIMRDRMMKGIRPTRKRSKKGLRTAKACQNVRRNRKHDEIDEEHTVTTVNRTERSCKRDRNRGRRVKRPGFLLSSVLVCRSRSRAPLSLSSIISMDGFRLLSLSCSLSVE